MAHWHSWLLKPSLIPEYNEKLDVFSFGNIIISTLIHYWPNPGPPNLLLGDQLVAVNELQRREYCTALFTAQEKQLFLPTIKQCLENWPDKHPSSVMLVQVLRHIESSFLMDKSAAAPLKQLCQQLSAKEEECQQINEEFQGFLKERDEVARERMQR